jgi:alkyldihydroxyacetonephosphate synthase
VAKLTWVPAAGSFHLMAIDRAYPEQSWRGWGDGTQVPVLPDGVLTLLRDGLGVKHPGPQAGALEDVELAPSRLADDAVAALGRVVGAEHALADDVTRVRHTRGKSTPDLLRVRLHDWGGAPDIVLVPGSHDEVMELLRICSERRIAVVPFGGGTSVVGGLEPDAEGYAGLAALDVRRLNALESLDEESRVAQMGPGLRGPEAEELLRPHGFTIGHFPQSFEYATLGGFAAARSSGQSSAGYGRFDDLVVGLRTATPAGTLELGRAPKSAAGPDLRQLVLGSEGAFGVITSLGIQLRPVPEERRYEGWRLQSFEAGAKAVRRLAQDGPLPTVLRLSDEAETALNLAQPSGIGAGSGGGCTAIVGYEGTAEYVGATQERVSALLAGWGATPAEGDAGESWARDRYRGPYLRDALIEAGALVETLETVTFWSRLQDLYAAVQGALRESLTAQGTPPVILCHISHVYRSGASLYFTIGCAQLDDPLAQWRAAKAATSDAILAAGGSITHHHGVGIDHRDWFEREIGDLGIGILRAVKGAVDPAWILNPGVLLRR